MKKIIIVLFLLSLSSGSFAKDLQWKNFNEGMAEAKRSGRKILVDVYTDWCKWCKKMDSDTYTDKKVKAYLEKHYVLIKLNAEGNENVSYFGQRITPSQFARQMGVDGYPATLFLKGSGDQITLLPGYSEPKTFIHVLTFINEDQYMKKNFNQYLAEKEIQ